MSAFDLGIDLPNRQTELGIPDQGMEAQEFSRWREGEG